MKKNELKDVIIDFQKKDDENTLNLEETTSESYGLSFQACISIFLSNTIVKNIFKNL